MEPRVGHHHLCLHAFTFVLSSMLIAVCVELYMVQDDSLDFKNTRAFVEKGLRELSMLSKAKQSVCKSVGKT